MPNVLLEKPEYKITQTSGGTWRRHMSPTGILFAEYMSNTTVAGFPLFHFTSGVSPETGAHVVARGFVAIGRKAVGAIAIGRFAAGIVAIGQLSCGVFAVGQLAAGAIAMGQLSVGIALAAGQIAIGYVSVAQLGFGEWVLAQLGIGRHIWTMRVKDPEAIEFFKTLLGTLRAG